jgi:hypothetical protein
MDLLGMDLVVVGYLRAKIVVAILVKDVAIAQKNVFANRVIDLAVA